MSKFSNIRVILRIGIKGTDELEILYTKDFLKTETELARRIYRTCSDFSSNHRTSYKCTIIGEVDCIFITIRVDEINASNMRQSYKAFQKEVLDYLVSCRV